MYVLVRHSDGKYVARSGSEQSYTKRLEDARKFSSREAAEADRCVQSERIANVSDILGGCQ